MSVILDAQYIAKDEYFTRNQPAKSEEIVNLVNVSTQPLVPVSELEKVFQTKDKISLSFGEIKTIFVEYSKPPVLIDGAVASIIDSEGGTMTINSADYFVWGAEVEVECTNGSSVQANVKIDGYPLEVQGAEIINTQDDDSIVTNGLQEYSYPENPLVQDTIMAQQIADNLLDAYKIARKDVTVVWKGNPALVLGDDIVVPEYERVYDQVLGTFKITRNTIEFDGTLKETTEGRKVNE